MSVFVVVLPFPFAVLSAISLRWFFCHIDIDELFLWVSWEISSTECVNASISFLWVEDSQLEIYPSWVILLFGIMWSHNMAISWAYKRENSIRDYDCQQPSVNNWKHYLRLRPSCRWQLKNSLAISQFLSYPFLTHQFLVHYGTKWLTSFAR